MQDVLAERVETGGGGGGLRVSDAVECARVRRAHHSVPRQSSGALPRKQRVSCWARDRGLVQRAPPLPLHCGESPGYQHAPVLCQHPHRAQAAHVLR
eukprot:CAMPEP_0114265024 /NCGR_PEP_ID=MMETSP0058-20121206/23627_1 /TAXON_ID=36894 /ORGANISM="Pyramimonas parkeae, CCMP726" /LENGTH=96 /DNA_ID=CAMNT_0001381953 /DNA_START=449 /DNA_END=736 /DNA_ORIENTATION=-